MATYQVRFFEDNGKTTECIVKAYGRYRALLQAVVETAVINYKNVSVKSI